MKTRKTTTPKKTTGAALNKAPQPAPLEVPRTKEALSEMCTVASRLTIERDAAQLKLDRRVLDLQESHGPIIDAMSVQIDRSVEVIHLWAIENRAAEFEGRQRIEVARCLLEFRKGSGKVVVDEDEDAAVDRIRALPESYGEEKSLLTREKWELNKSAVIAMWATEQGRAFLTKMGVRVVVEEAFRFTPAREELAPLSVNGMKPGPREMPASAA